MGKIMYDNMHREKIVYNNRMSYALPFQIFLAGYGEPNPHFRIEHNIVTLNEWDKYILEYVLDGRGFCETEQGRTEIHAGELFFMNKNRRIVYGAVPEEPYRRLFAVFHGTLADSLVQSYCITDSVVIRKTDMEGAFRRMLSLLERSTFDTWQEDMDKCALLVHEMLLALRPSPLRMEMEKPGSTAEKLKGYIDTNILLRNLTLEDLSNYFRMSQSQMIRLFRQTYGMTPGQYILQKRMEGAEYLLWNTKMSIGEIAARLHFHDSCYFTAVFRKHVGVSPTAFRKRSHG